jgi:RHS repeat-associated protein
VLRYRWAGREYDQETELHYLRARYYDPQLGRFLSEDPIGIAGGVNLYEYAGDDPVNASDASGLSYLRGDGAICEDYVWVTDWYDKDTGEYVRTDINAEWTTCVGGREDLSGAESGGSNKGKTKPKPKPGRCNAPTQFSGGVTGLIGGNPIVPVPGIFIGGGIAGGVSTNGQLFLQFSVSITYGPGVYAGVGFEGVIANSTGPLPPMSIQHAAIGQGYLGFGPSGGGSIMFGEGTAGVSRDTGRGGVGYGGMLAAGVLRTVTFAGPPGQACR